MPSQAFTRIVRRPEVRVLTGQTDTFIDRGMRNGTFPTPIRLSPNPKTRAVGWVSTEVAAVVDATISGADEATMRALVAQLVAARTQARAA